MIRRFAFLALLCLASCAPAPPRRPAPLPGPPAADSVTVAPPPPSQVWTREAGIALTGELPAAIPFAATRLEVLEVSPDSFRVRCVVCPGLPVGWVPRARVAWTIASPAAARTGDLAEFVLALRDAALRRDWEAMRAVMAPRFVHTISGPDGQLEAIGAWRAHRAADLARLPQILDRGVVLVPGTQVWAAPPEFAAMRGYQDLRAGFVRGAEGWEWIFLVRGEI